MYESNKIDFLKDKEGVITQVLNYGDWIDVTWLLNTFGEAEVKKTIAHPRRGRWWRKVLNFWTTVLEVAIPEATFENAVIKMRPDYNRLPPFVRERGRGKDF